MDGQKAPAKFDWLRDAMPGLATLMRRRRSEMGDAHVNECWRRGVVGGEPGWFFAREGPIALGTPWDDPECQAFGALTATADQVLLLLRPPGVAPPAPPFGPQHPDWARRISDGAGGWRAPTR